MTACRHANVERTLRPEEWRCTDCGVAGRWTALFGPDSLEPPLRACGFEAAKLDAIHWTPSNAAWGPFPVDLGYLPEELQLGRMLRPAIWYRARCYVDGALAGIARTRSDARGAAHFALPRPVSGRHYRWKIAPEDGADPPLVFELEALEEDDDGEL